MTTTTKWTATSRDAAEALAETTGLPVVFVADTVQGYARHLRDGETQSQAVVDFESAGEPATSSAVFDGSAASDDTGLVCGCRVQHDLSGVGHCWRDVGADDLPASVREEIEGEIIDGGREECDSFRASNGQHYRW